jgi:hypothetical protein
MRHANLAQRVVASIGLGLLLFVLASAIARWIPARGPDGWFNYAPDSGGIFSPAQVNGWSVLVYVASVVIWTAVSFRLFAGTRVPSEPDVAD